MRRKLSKWWPRMACSPPCPQCGSKKLWRDGLRYSPFGDSIQRWLCRNCGLRFSNHNPVESPVSKSQELERIDTNSLKVSCERSSDRQICVSEGEMINLAEVETRKQESPMREGTTPRLDEPAFKGFIAQLMAWLEKEGYPKENKYPNYLKTLVKLGANLLDPESVKSVIGKHDVKEGTKLQYVYAYAAFAKMLKIGWEPPKYRQEENLPFVPEESELDCIIASCHSKRMATYLQTLKETFADPGEALKLRWIDISSNIIIINKPVKGHLPRQLEVSNRLIAMLNSLPRTSERIFPTNYNVLFACYSKVRKRAANLHKNPRLLSIELRTFRHWGGTMLAHYTNGTF